MKNEIARLTIIANGPGAFSELSVRLVTVEDGNGAESCQLLCRLYSRELGGRNWTRSVETDCIRRPLEALSQSSLPAIPHHVLGFDGHSTELVINRGLNSVTYCWWCEPPPGYEPLARFSDELQDLAGAIGMIDTGRGPVPASGRSPGLSQRLSERSLFELAGRTVYAHGLRYMEIGAVLQPRMSDGRLHATVRGSSAYQAELWAEDDRIHFRCSCPAGQSEQCCKHVVATGLAWLVGDRGPRDPITNDLEPA